MYHVLHRLYFLLKYMSYVYNKNIQINDTVIMINYTNARQYCVFLVVRLSVADLGGTLPKRFGNSCSMPFSATTEFSVVGERVGLSPSKVAVLRVLQ